MAKSQTWLGNWTMTTVVFLAFGTIIIIEFFLRLYMIIWFIYINSIGKKQCLILSFISGTSKAFEQSKYLRNNWNKMSVSSYLCLNLRTYNQIIAWPRVATQFHTATSHSYCKAFHLEIIFKYEVSSKHLFELSKQVMLCTQYRI